MLGTCQGYLIFKYQWVRDRRERWRREREHKMHDFHDHCHMSRLRASSRDYFGRTLHNRPS